MMTGWRKSHRRTNRKRKRRGQWPNPRRHGRTGNLGVPDGTRLPGGAAHGIALQVIDKGRGSLKGGQVDVFEKFVVEKYFNLECRRCHAEMPTSEILAALAEEDELCSWCRKMESNDDCPGPTTRIGEITMLQVSPAHLLAFASTLEGQE